MQAGRRGAWALWTRVGHELIVNLKTAQEIGVTIPPEVLKRANQIIQF
jgi:ABC-type uncharacterized transport system substrate-binding protein